MNKRTIGSKGACFERGERVRVSSTEKNMPKFQATSKIKLEHPRVVNILWNFV